VRLTVTLLAAPGADAQGLGTSVYRIDHVADGATVTLANGKKVRLVQIGHAGGVLPTGVLRQTSLGCVQATASTRHPVRLQAEPATDRVDQYGRRSVM
jgi:hypothetical protein